MTIGIVGGGIAGLTAAYDLVKKGHKVLVVEQDAQLGGQAATFATDGEPLERFYHHLFKNDSHIIDLIRELELDGKLAWLESRTGVYHAGSIFRFVSPMDLMRFEPLGLLDRLRLGLIYVRLRRNRDWKKLESVTAKDWIVKHGSQRIYDVLWGPLLRGKFAESAEEVSMTWLWGKVYLRGASRSKTMAKEELGYLDGSFQVLIDALADKIRQGGGEVLTSARVERIVVENGRVRALEVAPLSARDVSGTRWATRVDCDTVIATVSSQDLLRMVPELIGGYADKLRQARYQTAVCAVLFLSQPLSQTYWLNISDRSIPFVGAIEHTNLVRRERYGGSHVVYLTNYLSPSHPLYGKSDGELIEGYLPYLRRINPCFDESWVRRTHVFRDTSGQPIVTTDYSKTIPEHRTPIDGLYLANTTQIYPEDRGTNYSVGLGRTIARIVEKDY